MRDFCGECNKELRLIPLDKPMEYTIGGKKFYCYYKTYCKKCNVWTYSQGKK